MNNKHKGGYARAAALTSEDRTAIASTAAKARWSKRDEPKLPKNTGFDDRVFLTEQEWQTYLRRPPVRYISHKKGAACEACGSTSNPLEHSHVIGFLMGVKLLALTPDWLDRRENIRTGCRGACNASFQLSYSEAVQSLKDMGLELPAFALCYKEG